MRLLLRILAVKAATGKSESRLYEEIAEGTFTKSVNTGGRTVAWPSTEVDAINSARVAGWTDDQIKELVIHLHEQRKTAALGLMGGAK